MPCCEFSYKTFAGTQKYKQCAVFLFAEMTGQRHLHPDGTGPTGTLLAPHFSPEKATFLKKNKKFHNLGIAIGNV